MKATISAALGAAFLATTAQAAPVLWDVADGGNGHYYELRDGEYAWTDGFAAAAASQYEGLQGYLVTLTSAAEIAFIISNVYAGRYWAGGSDAGAEGVWTWRNGPEAGQVFWNGGPGGSTPPGAYANWSSGEPNQHAGNPENYVLANWIGATWNDAAAGSPFAYIIEYGGIRVSNGVPEPAAWALMILGFGLAGAGLRARRQASFA